VNSHAHPQPYPASSCTPSSQPTVCLITSCADFATPSLTAVPPVKIQGTHTHTYKLHVRSRVSHTRCDPSDVDFVAPKPSAMPFTEDLVAPTLDAKPSDEDSVAPTPCAMPSDEDLGAPTLDAMPFTEDLVAPTLDAMPSEEDSVAPTLCAMPLMKLSK
jgi:hypothetical protein